MQQRAAKNEQVLRSSVTLPRNSTDIQADQFIELIDHGGVPIPVRGWLDDGAMPGPGQERAESSKPSKTPEAIGLIDSKLADRLQIPQLPYRGPALKSFNSESGVPKAQITVKWRLCIEKDPKNYHKAVFGIWKDLERPCIIGSQAINDAKLKKWNEDVVQIGDRSTSDTSRSFRIPLPWGWNSSPSIQTPNPT